MVNFLIPRHCVWYCCFASLWMNLRLEHLLENNGDSQTLWRYECQSGSVIPDSQWRWTDKYHNAFYFRLSHTNNNITGEAEIALLFLSRFLKFNLEKSAGNSRRRKKRKKSETHKRSKGIPKDDVIKTTFKFHLWQSNKFDAILKIHKRMKTLYNKSQTSDAINKRELHSIYMAAMETRTINCRCSRRKRNAHVKCK